MKPYILGSDTSGNRTTIGEKLFMQCQITGIPTPMVTWTKDDTPLVNRTDGSLIIVTIGDISKVEINKSKVNDSGKYTCNATNSAGSVSQEFIQEVSVNGEGWMSGYFTYSCINNNWVIYCLFFPTCISPHT